MSNESEKESRPEGAVSYGKCPECGEMAWLFEWEGDEPACEGCIDETHDRMHEAEDIMNEPVDWQDEEFYEEEGEEYF